MKYFITSDIHSFYTPLIKGLEEAGFDINNPEHTLIINGDLFDRGAESAEVLKFIQSIPKKRRILIRGNHEYLLKDLSEKYLPQSHDWSNGTVFTMFQLYRARHPKTTIFKEYENFKIQEDMQNWYIRNDWIEVQKFNEYFYYSLNTRTWHIIQKDLLDSGLLDWIFSDEWVNYFELGNYIITHSFIPMNHYHKTGTYYDTDYREYKIDWRTNSTKEEWNDATWHCPYELFDKGYFNKEKEKGKVLVCGHWHAKDFHIHYESDLNDLVKYYRSNYGNITNEIYYGDSLIALDACTVLSDFINVLIIDENYNLYNQHGEKLTKEISKSKLKMIKPIIETITKND